MFNSILDNHGSAQFDELVPRSALPWVGFGFVFALAFFIAEFALFLPNIDEQSFNFVFVLIMLAGWIYWLFCVHRFHKILGEMSHNHYPITPGEAVGKHFIPFYNIIWLFRWPSSFSDYINDRGRVKIVSGNLIGLLLLVSFLLRFFDGAIGLACMFGVGMYLAEKLRRQVEAVKANSPDMLPPPPDKSLFGYAPVETGPTSPQPESPGSMRQL